MQCPSCGARCPTDSRQCYLCFRPLPAPPGAAPPVVAQPPPPAPYVPARGARQPHGDLGALAVAAIAIVVIGILVFGVSFVFGFLHGAREAAQRRAAFTGPAAALPRASFPQGGVMPAMPAFPAAGARIVPPQLPFRSPSFGAAPHGPVGPMFPNSPAFTPPAFHGPAFQPPAPHLLHGPTFGSPR